MASSSFPRSSPVRPPVASNNPRRRRSQSAAAILAACATGWLTSRPAHAATLTWTNGGGDQLWSNSLNWGGTAAAGNDLVFGNTGAVATQGVITNSLTSSISINSLLYNQSYNTGTTANIFHTTSIASGAILTISGTAGLRVGMLNPGSAAAGVQTVTTITGAGQLVVNNTNSTAAISIGNDTQNGNGTSFAVLDMSGLSRFSATSGAFLIGASVSGTNGTSSRAQGTVILADTNVLNTPNITVGYVNTNNRFSSLTLGRSNTVNVDTFYIGRDKAQATVQFGTGFTSAANLVLRGTGTNTRVANVIIADISAETTSGTTPGPTTLDLRGGTVDAMITNLTVGIGQGGVASGGGSTQGSVLFGAGTLDVTTITLGKTSGTTAANAGRAMGTLTLSGGTTKAGSIVLGQQASLATAWGFLNVNGGNLQLTGDILDGNGTSSLVVNGGTISTVGNIGSGSQSIDTFALTSGSIGTVNNVFVSTISGSGAITNLKGTLTLNQTAAQTFAGSIAGAGSLVKNGNALLTLTGTNSFTGSTTINAGTVALSGAGTLAATQTIRMADGTTLDASGATGGAYSLNAGQLVTGIAGAGGTANFKGAFSLNPGAALMPGGSNTVGTFAFANDLTFGDKTTLNYDLNTFTDPGSNDLITVGGNLTFNGTTLLSISRLGQDVANGTYELFTYGGALTGGATNFVLGGVLGSGTRHTYGVDTTSTPGAVNLLVGGSGPAGLVWTGAASNVWNVQGTLNWTNGGSPDLFYQQDNVTFDDSSSVTNVTLAQVLQPSSVNVSANQNYTFTGTGSISGNASLTKSGNGTLTLANSGVNDYTGVTEVDGGTLQVGAGGTAGNLPAGFGVTNNANLAFNRSDNVTFSGNISGSGNVRQLGPGTLSLGGANTFTGTTTVNAGVLRTLTPTALGTTDGATIIQPGATLDVAGQNLGGEPIFVAGTGAAGLNGAIVNSGADQTTALRLVTLTGDTTLGGNGGRWDVRNTGGTAQLDMGGFNLTKAGTNYVALVGAPVVNPGNINVTAGTFSLESTTTLGGGATNTIAVSGTSTVLQLYSTATPFPWTLQANGGILRAGNGTANAWSGPVAFNANTNVDVASGASLTISGNLSGTGALSKTTAGALFLTGTNSAWSGTIGLTAGTLSVNSDAALGAVPASPVTDISVFGSSTLQLTSSFNPATNRNILVSGTGTTLTFDNGNNAVVIGSVISGSGNITKAGGTALGGLTLTAANTFTGNVTVNNGTVTITNSLAFGTTTGTNVKTVTVNAGTAGNDAVRLNGIAAPINLGTNVAFVTSNASGTIFNDAGNNSIAGALTMSSGGGNTVVEVDGGTLMLSGPISANTTGRFLQLQGPGNGTVSGSISNGNTPGLTKLGTGTWTLTGSNAYTGATTLSGGALIVNGTINAGSAVAVSNSAILGGGVGANAGTVGGNVTVSAGAVSPGANGTNATAVVSTAVLKAGAVAFTGGSNTTFQVDIAGAGGEANAGLTYDELVTANAAGVSGSNVRLLVNDAGFAPAANAAYEIIRGATTAANSISFVNFDGSAIDGTGATQFLSTAGNAYTLNVNGTDGAGNTAVVLTAVPEPTTLALLTLASAGVLARRRRRTAPHDA